MKDDADQLKDNDDVLPSGEAAWQCQYIQFKYTTNDLVTRCLDYDKVILDLQSLIMSLSNTVSDFKSHSNPPTTDGNNSWQVSDSNSHNNVLLQSPEIPLTNSAQLGPTNHPALLLLTLSVVAIMIHNHNRGMQEWTRCLSYPYIGPICIWCIINRSFSVYHTKLGYPAIAIYHTRTRNPLWTRCENGYGYKHM